MSIFIVLFTTILLILSAFVVLVILMQKPSANAGMGSALGGGAAEQAFGGDAANVLTKTTVFAIVGYFILAFVLYLGNLAMVDRPDTAGDGEELQSLVSGFAEEAENTPAETIETPVIDESTAVSLDAILDEKPAEAANETPVEPKTPPVE